MKSFIVLTVTFVFLSLTAPTAWGDGKETVDAKAVFETKCSACHNADRAKSVNYHRQRRWLDKY